MPSNWQFRSITGSERVSLQPSQHAEDRDPVCTYVVIPLDADAWYMVCSLSRVAKGLFAMMIHADKPYSILIADDDPFARETLRDIVEPEGYRPILASSGEEALEIVQGTSVHLALFDMHMNRLTGLETVQLVHQVNQLLPCILVTADASEDLMRKAFNVRAYSVIPKPVSRHVLLYTMLKALVKVYGSLLGEERDDQAAAE